VTTGTMALGDTVTWRARHFGVVWRMASRITAYDHPTHFVDEQTAGPFHHWWHARHFTPDGRGGTRNPACAEERRPRGDGRGRWCGPTGTTS
ncbi:SRPBCC family protein, partial [Streptomyces albidoflavus]|uniref:SRPBCC family protein n=1 Tax=Streptomyces albidoflavus TaxID=1886 RepID=UPI0038D1907B